MIYEFNAAEVFEIAIQIEENGRKFYEKAQEKIADPEIRAVFDYLAVEEVKHKMKFEELKAKLPESAKESKVWDPEDETGRYLKMMADMHVFRSEADLERRIGSIGSGAEALNLAIQFEKDSIVFFLAVQEETDENQGKKLIGQLVKEEQGHLKKLSLQLRKLKG